jgi:hypothetical protein
MANIGRKIKTLEDVPKEAPARRPEAEPETVPSRRQMETAPVRG